MELEKTKLMNDLIDLYGVLLTDNQLMTLECYYMDDLSLSEIAQNLNVTRSAVHDTIKKASNILINYEEKLRLLEKENIKKEILARVNDLSKEELIKEIEKL